MVIDVVIVLIDMVEVDDGVVLRLVERDIMPTKRYHTNRPGEKLKLREPDGRVSEGYWRGSPTSTE